MSNASKDINKKINQKLWDQQFTSIRHIEYDKEFGIYTAIAAGDRKEATRLNNIYLDTIHNKNSMEQNGILSKDPILNAKYHVVVFISLATRYCVRYGLNRELAYSISDVLIQELDDCHTIESVEAIREQALETFTTHMQRNKNQSVYSMPVARCLEYIHNNLQQNLKLDIIAEQVGLHPSYLSRLFKQEMKTTISAYIKQQRLISACRMLELSSYNIAEISEMLRFSSQSHFTSSFLACYGVTPKKYRDLRARSDWKNTN